jgi:hypothetical protein
MRWMALGLIALLAACDAEGRWPGAGGGDGDGPPDEFPDAAIDDPPVPDAGIVVDGSNIVANGGFERANADGTFAARWEKNDDNPGGAIAIVTDPTYTGQDALEFDIGASGEGYEFFVIQNGLSAERLVPGGTFELSGFYRIDQVGGGSINFNYILRSESGDPDIGNEWDNTHPQALDTWESFAWQFTIPSDYAGESYQLFLHFIKFTGIRVVLQVDEVSLLRIQ